jgi:hypothetical protein
MEIDSKWISEKRSQVDFSPKDHDQVLFFERDLNPKESALIKYTLYKSKVEEMMQ